MKISYNWLKDFIETDKSAAEIGNLLTNCGLEVEDISTFCNIPGALEGIVIGQVLSVEKHPNADKLSICQVDTEKGVTQQIVCGAPNVAANQKVLVATVGSTVYPTTGEPFTISKAKIRGVESAGMICAEDELGLGNSHEGILILPEHFEVGKPAHNYFNIYSDQILEIGLTANRGDAASHYGVARDLFALGIKRLRKELEQVEMASTESSIGVSIEEGSGCLRYSGLVINHVGIKPSPEWLQNRLKAIGLSPINNIVDATNFILHSWGQPLHAFDADKIAGRQIIVKKAVAGSTFTTLDKVERKLSGIECMICDAEKPLALAGVFGGMDSGVSSETQNIFLESAYFEGAVIRKAAKAHGLNTDASFRFERGTDPNITFETLHHAAALILKIAGGYVPCQIIDIYPQPIPDRSIVFSPSKSNALIGKDIPFEIQKKILGDLQILVRENKTDEWVLTVPPYRVDIERPVDITEEILRIYGFNNIDSNLQMQSALSYSEDEFGLNLKNRLANFLSANGFFEIATNSLTKSAYYTQEQIDNAVKLLNPLSNDLNIMRPDMIFSVLESVQYNNNRKNQDLRFFEFANTYQFSGEAENLKSYSEHKHLTLALLGRKEPESWNNGKQEIGYFGVKNIIEQIARQCGLGNLSYTYESDEQFEMATQIIIKKKVIGFWGLVKQSMCKPFDIDKPLWYADFNVDALFELASNVKFKLKPVSVFPMVRRDLAMLISNEITYTQLEKIAFKTEPNLLRQINVFDVYQGDKIEQGKKSYALSFILQDDSKTLTDETIDAVMKKLIANYEKDAGAVLRS